MGNVVNLERRLNRLERREAEERALNREIAELTVELLGVECSWEVMWDFMSSNNGWRFPIALNEALKQPIRSRQYDEHVAGLFAQMKEDFLAWQLPPAA